MRGVRIRKLRPLNRYRKTSTLLIFIDHLEFVLHDVTIMRIREIKVIYR